MKIYLYISFQDVNIYISFFQDIRKFFGPHTAGKKSAEATKRKDEASKNKDITLKNKDITPKNKATTPKNKATTPKNKATTPNNKDRTVGANKTKLSNSDSKKNLQPVADSTGKKETSLASCKKPAVADEVPMIIEDSSDEEVVANSDPSSEKRKHSTNSVDKTEVKCKSVKVFSADEKASSRKSVRNGKTLKRGKTDQRQGKGRSDDDIESVDSSSSSVSVAASVSVSASKTFSVTASASVSVSPQRKKSSQKRDSQDKVSENSSKHAKHVAAEVEKNASKKKNTQLNGEGKGGKSHKRKQV